MSHGTSKTVTVDRALFEEAISFVDRHSESWYRSGQDLLARLRAAQQVETSTEPPCDRENAVFEDMETAAYAFFSTGQHAVAGASHVQAVHQFAKWLDEGAPGYLRRAPGETPAEPCPACTEAHAQITDFGIGDGDIADRVGDLIERLCDCEISLGVFDPGAAAEYWLKYGTRAPEASSAERAG